MKDQEKVKEQLVEELQGLRQRIAALETSESTYRRTAKTAEQKGLFLQELLDLQEREHQLVAYEIHDGLAQQLAGAQMRLGGFLQAYKEHCTEEGQCLLVESHELLTESVSEARRLVDGLRPAMLDSGIVAAVDCLIREAEKREGAEIEFIHSLESGQLASPLGITVLRIIQEALTNAWQHSQSKRIRVKLIGRGDHVCIEVQDWGIGFNLEQVEEDCFGLQGIQERAKLFGGHVTIDTAANKGTRIAVELPLLFMRK